MKKPDTPEQIRHFHEMERAAAKRWWLAQAEQFAAECGYVKVTRVAAGKKVGA